MNLPISPPSSSLYIGLMSGTSLDGVDGVLADIPDDFAARPPHTLAAAFVAFPAALRSDLMALQTPGYDEIEREASAAHALVQLYAECVAQLLAQAGAPLVRAIGVHGQTIRHRPEAGFSRQINHPALLAELTGIDVIADFRSRDIAAGGQGAPLVPAFHQAVFGRAGETRVVINIGGISNISVLPGEAQAAGVTQRGVIGYDTGPGNVLMDGWIARHQGQEYDADGAWAAAGLVNHALLSLLRQEAFFQLAPPKSTGRDLFHLAWLDARLQEFSAPLAPIDVQATLAALTATTIADAVTTHAAAARCVYVCGGGAYNHFLMRQLSVALQQRGQLVRLESTPAHDIAPNHVEAWAFAWLAQRFCQRLPANLPSVTGAKGLRILGALYPGA